MATAPLPFRSAMAHRQDVGRVTGSHDDLRVVVPFPRWPDLVALIGDEIILAARESPAVLHRLDGLLTGVLEPAHPARQPAVRDRLASIERFRTALAAPLRPDEHIDTAS